MRQRLGQHFLKNKSVIKKIIAELDWRAGEIVIEIGPGHGELTHELIQKTSNGEIILIEKDPELASKLVVDFENQKNLTVLTGDALEILPNLIAEKRFDLEKYKVVGNLPYYITGKLFRVLSEAKNKPALSIFTIQLEVAERMVAEPPKMNRLAAIVQFWSTPKIVARVARTDFSPPPEIDSAVIKLALKNDKRQLGLENEEYFEGVVRLFQQPRKTIGNNLLSEKVGREKIAETLKSLGVNPGARPQDLSIAQITEIARKFRHFPYN